MWTAVLATLNLLDGTDFDVWSVNTEAEYHEAGDVVEGALEFYEPTFQPSTQRKPVDAVAV